MSVYFITCRMVNMVKIGCAYNPRRRLDTMQCGCPVELTLEAMLKGSFVEEREYHARFDHLRVRGEWFRITAEIEEIIVANPPPTTKSNPLFLKRAREMQGKRPSDRYDNEDARRYAEAMTAMRAEQGTRRLHADLDALEKAE